MGQLVDNLIDAYRVSITNSDWLGEETKAKALEKLSKFTPMIGYTERWRDYTAFDVHADAGLVANMQPRRSTNGASSCPRPASRSTRASG